MCVCLFVCLQASFAADGSVGINVDDPDFWQKWAAKANLDLEELANKVSLGVWFCWTLNLAANLPSCRTVSSWIRPGFVGRSVATATTASRRLWR